MLTTPINTALNFTKFYVLLKIDKNKPWLVFGVYCPVVDTLCCIFLNLQNNSIFRSNVQIFLNFALIYKFYLIFAFQILRISRKKWRTCNLFSMISVITLSQELMFDFLQLHILHILQLHALDLAISSYRLGFDINCTTGLADTMIFFLLLSQNLCHRN